VRSEAETAVAASFKTAAFDRSAIEDRSTTPDIMELEVSLSL